MKFGIFLVEKRLISAEQFTEAVSIQQQDRVPLGQLAMDSGQLTKIHVLHILSLQSKKRRLFGELALELNYLTKPQLAELLLKQDQLLKPISEILMATGAISREQRDFHLKEYRLQLADMMDPSGVLRSVV